MADADIEQLVRGLVGRVDDLARTISNLPISNLPISNLPISNIPIPDPSIITDRYIQALREEVRRDAVGLREIIETRLDAMDKANQLLADHFTLCPSKETVEKLLSMHKSTSDEKIAALSEMIVGRIKINMNRVDDMAGSVARFEEKFGGIQTQLKERDERAKISDESAKLGIKDAMEASNKLAAQIQTSNTEAITKSDAATNEKIDGLTALFRETINPLRDQLTGVGTRVTALETTSRTGSDNRNEQRQSVGLIVGVIGGAFGLILTIVAVITLVFSLTHNPVPVVPGAPLTVTVPGQK